MQPKMQALLQPSSAKIGSSAAQEPSTWPMRLQRHQLKLNPSSRFDYSMRTISIDDDQLWGRCTTCSPQDCELIWFNINIILWVSSVIENQGSTSDIIMQQIFICFRHIYESELSPERKIETIASKMYGAKSVIISEDVASKLNAITAQARVFKMLSNSQLSVNFNQCQWSYHAQIVTVTDSC